MPTRPRHDTTNTTTTTICVEREERPCLLFVGAGAGRSVGRYRALQGEDSLMRVWIDQDLCTGDGLCNDHSTDVFRLAEDGISYVRDAVTGEWMTDPGGRSGIVQVPRRLEQVVVDAAMVCPGECIFIEEDADYERS